MILAKVIFLLGMNYAQIKHICPKQLLPMSFQGNHYYACDDGKKTTVLAIENDKLIAIMDLKWFSIVMDQDSLPPRDCKYVH